MKDFPVEIGGIVTRFKGNGRKLGYPTANLKTTTKLPDGVFFGFAELGKYSNHPALIFIGTPTTVGDKGRRVEAYLLDIPDIDYYDQEMKLSVYHHHRPNQTFKSIGELKTAIKNDEVAGREWFAKNPEGKKA